jgi:hypothetical protein
MTMMAMRAGTVVAMKAAIANRMVSNQSWTDAVRHCRARTSSNDWGWFGSAGASGGSIGGDGWNGHCDGGKPVVAMVEVAAAVAVSTANAIDPSLLVK